MNKSEEARQNQEKNKVWRELKKEERLGEGNLLVHTMKFELYSHSVKKSITGITEGVRIGRIRKLAIVKKQLLYSLGMWLGGRNKEEGAGERMEKEEKHKGKIITLKNR